MRHLAAALLCVALAACDYTEPLVATPEIGIDPAAVGLWKRTDPRGNLERLLVLPLGEREYLVSYLHGTDNAMFARGTLWRGAGMTLAQLDWFGTARGDVPDNDRTYQYAAWGVQDGTMRVGLLNTDVVSKDIASSSELAAAIAANSDSPALFREELVFQKVVD